MSCLALCLAVCAAPAARPTPWLLDATKLTRNERILAASAQGIANRAGPTVFLRILPTDDEWVRWYTARFGMKFRHVADVYDLVRDLGGTIKGYILYDELEPETINVAATLAGIRNAVMATPETAPGLDKIGLKCLVDLRGRFNDWSRARIYQWLYDHEFPAAAHDCIANNHGRAGLVRIDVSKLAGRRVFVRFEDATKLDGMGAKFTSLRVIADGRQVLKFAAGSPEEAKHLVDSDGSWFAPDGDRVADRTQHFTYAVDLPRGAKSIALVARVCNGYEILLGDAENGPFKSVAKTEGVQSPFGINFLDYCICRRAADIELSSVPVDKAEYALKTRFYRGLKPFSPVFSWTGDESVEVSQTSRNALLMICCDATNFSFHAAVKTNYKFHQQPPPHRATLDRSKVYVSFVLSDGDALHWVTRFQGGQWFMPERGLVPFGWEIQPLLATMAPAEAQYFYEHATPNDYLVAAASGVGYVHPEELPADKLAEYVRLTRRYIERMDERVVTVLSARNVDANVISAYGRGLGDSAVGCQEGYGWREPAAWFVDHGLGWARSLVYTYPLKKREAALQELKDIAAKHPQRPLFIPYHLFCYSQSIADAKWWMDNLPPEFEVVRPDEFFRLEREAYSGTVQLADPPDYILAPENASLEVAAPVRNNGGSARQATVDLLKPSGKAASSTTIIAPPWSTTPVPIKLAGLGAADVGKWTLRLIAGASTQEHSFALQVAPLPAAYAGRPVEMVFARPATAMLGLVGKTTPDPASTTGAARYVALAGLAAPTHAMFGPYLPLPAGDYAAVFLLRATGTASADTPVAVADVVGAPQGEVPYGSKTLTLADLEGSHYRPIVIPFHIADSETGLETRVFDLAKADLWIDNVAIFRFRKK